MNVGQSPNYSELLLTIVAIELRWKGAVALVSIVKVWPAILQRFGIINEFYSNKAAAFAYHIVSFMRLYLHGM